LVADLADVAVLRGQHRERGAVADGHQEQEAAVHLDDRLQDGAAFEASGGALGEAHQSRGDGRQLVGAVPRQVPRGGQQQTVGADRDGVGHARHAFGEAG
ncbi:hypothetical protein ADL26_02680, partial [Thermoactinomyces vulgaris]